MNYFLMNHFQMSQISITVMIITPAIFTQYQLNGSLYTPFIAACSCAVALLVAALLSAGLYMDRLTGFDVDKEVAITED